MLLSHFALCNLRLESVKGHFSIQKDNIHAYYSADWSLPAADQAYLLSNLNAANCNLNLLSL